MADARARPWHVLLLLLVRASAAEGPHEHYNQPSSGWRERAASWEPLLGHVAFNITTRSAEAQRLFGIGLLFLYNFDQANAKAVFQEALKADPECAMCAWGVAHACGPFLNRPAKGPPELALGLAAARRAAALLAQRPAAFGAKERALVGAMAVRYPENPVSGNQTASYVQYAAVLHKLRVADASLQEDPDMMVFDAEAMMILMCDQNGTYHFYETRGDTLPPLERAEIREATGLLQAALARTGQAHPYAHHLLIHSTEMSNDKAETAVKSAYKLLKDMMGLQDNHLQHMTSHTFLRTGRYHSAVVGNEAAVKSEAAFMKHGLVPYSPGHDTAFLVIAAMYGGERGTAYHYAEVLRRLYVAAPARPDGPDGSQAWGLPQLAALRFGDWGRVGALDALPPGNFSTRWSYGYGVLRHFSSGVAAARLGKSAEAQAHLTSLRGLAPAVAGLGKPKLENLTAIANHTLAGVLAHSRGDLSGAVEALGRAVEQQMAMPYDEPPNWPLPTRECYGQALLDAGRPQDAEQIFRYALYGFSFQAEPHCGWALFGLRASLLQQSRSEERVREVRNLTQQIRTAWRHADVELRSSCSLLGDVQTLQFV